MIIDEEDELTLTRYKGKVVKADHKMLKLEINLTFHKEKGHERVEVFNVKNKQAQMEFYKFTSRDTRFSKCFSPMDESVDIQFRKWQRVFDKTIHACFRKIRIKENSTLNPSEIDKLLNEKRMIMKRKSKLMRI